jgi:catalase
LKLRQIGHFYKADPDYGNRVAAGLGVNIRDVVSKAA